MAVLSLGVGRAQPAGGIERPEGVLERATPDWCWPRPAPRVLLGFELLCAWCRRLRGGR
jgi:hypothetical protein